MLGEKDIERERGKVSEGRREEWREEGRKERYLDVVSDTSEAHFISALSEVQTSEPIQFSLVA